MPPTLGVVPIYTVETPLSLKIESIQRNWREPFQNSGFEKDCNMDNKFLILLNLVIFEEVVVPLCI